MAASIRMFPGVRFDLREPVPPRFANFVAVPKDDVGRSSHVVNHQTPTTWKTVGAGGASGVGDGQRHFAANYVRDVAHPGTPGLPHNDPMVVNEQQQYRAKRGFLPPLSSSIKVQIVHDTAKFTVTHVFWNRSDLIEQGTYQFPLPLDATVTDFNCRIGANKVIRGKVKGKEEARRAFNDAVRRGRTGGLVEQQTADIFTIDLANIEADTKMRAELSFMCLLKHRGSNDRDIFTLTVPTFIAPRFGTVPKGVLMGQQFHHSLSFEADVLTADELIAVTSDTHNISFDRGVGQRACQTWDDFVNPRETVEAHGQHAGTIQLEDSRTSLDKDMVITISTAQSDSGEMPHACLETHPELDYHASLMLTIPSEFLLTTRDEGLAHNGGEIVFVADRSGSMGDKMESLRSAMLFFINGIPENRPFNIWCFGSHVESLWPRSRRFGEETRLEALNYVQESFQGDMGGTDILPALQGLYEARGGYQTLDAIVLTDGAVWGTSNILNFVKDRSLASEGLFRCFSLGIGRAVSHELVEGLAKAGGGYAEVIANAHSGGWEDRVVAVLRAALTGHVDSVEMELEWHGEDGHELVQAPPVSFKQSPADMSSLNPFVRNRVFLLFDSGEQQAAKLGAIRLKSIAPGGEVSTRRVLPKRLLQPDDTLHKLAVRALLGDLDRGESWLHRGPGGVDASIFRGEAIDLGIKWSLVSRWTSLYAIEEETTERLDINVHIQINQDQDHGEDALLQPRNMADWNTGMLVQGSPAHEGLETASQSDLSDGEDGGAYGSHESDENTIASVRLRTPLLRMVDANVAYSMSYLGANEAFGMSYLDANEAFDMSLDRNEAFDMSYLDANEAFDMSLDRNEDFDTSYLDANEAFDMSLDRDEDFDTSYLDANEACPTSFRMYKKVKSKARKGKISERDTERSVSKTEEELSAERFVRDMLMFQRADGSFHFRDDEELKGSLGPSFFAMVASLKQFLVGDKTTESTKRLLAVAAAVLAILKEQFTECQALWVMMADKIKGYLTMNSSHEQAATQLMDEAERHTKTMASIMDEVKDMKERDKDVSVLAAAPTIAQ